MFNWFRKKPQPAHGGAGVSKGTTLSFDAMVACAEREGFFNGKDFVLIPELVGICRESSEFMYSLVTRGPEHLRETMVFHTSRYLFAKGVEAAILWGLSPDGRISMGLEPSDVAQGKFTSDLPDHLVPLAVKSRSIGEQLFKAHQETVVTAQQGRLPSTSTPKSVRPLSGCPASASPMP